MSRDRDQEILRLRSLGWSQARIAGQVGVTQQAVSYVLTKYGARSKNRPRRDVRSKAWVKEFLENPDAFPEQANLSPSTSLHLLEECRERVDANHVVARPDVEASIELFSGRVERAKRRGNLSLERRFRCSYVQAVGMLAACDRRSCRLAEAESRLRLAMRRYALGCVACLADLYRRLGLVLADQGRFNEALQAFSKALELYQRVRGAGHDLDGLPREKCLAARGSTYVEFSKFHLAEADAQAALPLVPETRKSLRLNLLTVLAWSQLGLPGRFEGAPRLPDGSQVAAAKETLFKAVALFDQEDLETGHSVARASIYWLSGVVDGLEGHQAAAQFKLTVARDDFRAIPMPNWLTICAADLAELGTVNPRQAQLSLAESLSWPKVPLFLSDYVEPLSRALRPGLDLPEILPRIREVREIAAAREVPGQKTAL